MAHRSRQRHHDPVRAGVKFISTDFRGIQIPGADLSYSLFDSVQFQGADLRKVNLRGAWLRKTDLSKADMTEVQFGELPYITMDNAVETCIFSPDGKYFAVGQRDGKAHVFSTSNWKKVQTLAGHTETVLRVVFSPDGTRIATASWDATICVWDLFTGYIYRFTNHTEGVGCVGFSREREELAFASHDKTIRLWNLNTWRMPQDTFWPHGSSLLRRVFTQRDESDCFGRLGQYDTPVEHYDRECLRVFDNGHRDKI